MTPPNKDPDRILTHEEVLVILSRQAEDGSVTVAAALAREIRARDRKRQSLDEELDQMLSE
jgi:hypothetical protein